MLEEQSFQEVSNRNGGFNSLVVLYALTNKQKLGIRQRSSFQVLDDVLGRYGRKLSNQRHKILNQIVSLISLSDILCNLRDK